MLHRHIEDRLRSALSDTPVVLVHGARQTGKSTLVKSVAEKAPRRRYLTFDDATVLSAAAADPAGFLSAIDGPVVLDEVQKLPALFAAIKAEVDRRRRPGWFLLTGSANTMLMPRISESLAGRIEIITLWPLSQGEIEERGERFIDAAFSTGALQLEAQRRGRTLIERIVRGGYPEPQARSDPDRRSAWYSSYITTILQRDIRDLSGIEGLTDLPRLLRLIATRTGGLLNFADLSRGLSMPQSTLKRYFTLLEATFLVHTVPAWSSNRGLRLTKAPKVMLCDTGLACNLIGADADRLAAEGGVRGPLVENFVAMELMRQATWSKTMPATYHFRTPGGKEVDLVLENAAGKVVGIEVKASSTVSADDLGGLKTLADAAAENFLRGIVLYAGSEVISFDRRFMAIPINALWS